MALDVEKLYNKYGPMVYRRCKSLLKDDDSAMDAMQDVFTILVRKKDDLQDKGLSSLLYTIATNVCLNLMRKNKKTDNSPTYDEVVYKIASTENHEERVLSGHFLKRLFAEEKASTQTIALYHYVEGYTLKETAEMVGMSVSGIQKRLRMLKEKGLKLKEV